MIIEGFEVQGPAAEITYDMAITERNWKVKCDQDGLNYTHNYFSGLVFGVVLVRTFSTIILLFETILYITQPVPVFVLTTVTT